MSARVVASTQLLFRAAIMLGQNGDASNRPTRTLSDFRTDQSREQIKLNKTR